LARVARNSQERTPSQKKRNWGKDWVRGGSWEARKSSKWWKLQVDEANELMPGGIHWCRAIQST